MGQQAIFRHITHADAHVTLSRQLNIAVDTFFVKTDHFEYLLLNIYLSTYKV